MKWLRCCYCCCCWSKSSSEKVTTIDDASSLIQEGSSSGGGGESDVQAFYVPRRHSSFHSTTFNSVTSIQPGRSQSDSCSSSGDDDSPHMEQRGRCWSTIPTSNIADMAALMSDRITLENLQKNHISNGSHEHSSTTKCSRDSPEGGVCSGGKCKGPLHFDKHKLTEIREVDQSDAAEDEDTPTNGNEVYGYLSFSTAYDEQEQKLSIFLEKATDLPKKSTNPDQELYNTYVRMVITSNRKNFLMSRTVKNNLNPVYREEHVFHTNRAKWKSLWNNCLKLSVYDCDRQGHHDAVGHVLLSLSKITDIKEAYCLPLTPMATPVKNVGQLLVGLFYSALQSRLSINVIKGRHLRLDPEAQQRKLKPISKDKEVLDTFVKVTLMCGGQKVKTHRSQVIADKNDPFYNSKSDFVVPSTFLPETSVVITVVVKGVLGRTTPLGRVCVGPYVQMANGVPTQWGRMLQDTRSVVQWRNLYL